MGNSKKKINEFMTTKHRGIQPNRVWCCVFVARLISIDPKIFWDHYGSLACWDVCCCLLFPEPQKETVFFSVRNFNTSSLKLFRTHHGNSWKLSSTSMDFEEAICRFYSRQRVFQHWQLGPSKCRVMTPIWVLGVPTFHLAEPALPKGVGMAWKGGEDPWSIGEFLMFHWFHGRE